LDPASEKSAQGRKEGKLKIYVTQKENAGSNCDKAQGNLSAAKNSWERGKKEELQGKLSCSLSNNKRAEESRKWEN